MTAGERLPEDLFAIRGGEGDAGGWELPSVELHAALVTDSRVGEHELARCAALLGEAAEPESEGRAGADHKLRRATAATERGVTSRAREPITRQLSKFGGGQ